MIRDELDRNIKALEEQGVSQRDIAKKLGVAPSTVLRRSKKMRSSEASQTEKETPQKRTLALPEIERWDTDQKTLAPEEERPQGGLEGLLWEAEKEPPIDELLERQRANYRRKKASKKDKIKRIRVADGLPIAICHIGDPHVDASGFNVDEMQRVLATIARTQGMYAGNLGDVVNNWVGRLMAQYAHQNTTLDDAVRLERWLLTACPWAYLVIGNHDHWNQGAYLLREILKDVAVGAIGEHEVRLEFDFGEMTTPIRLIARHQFKGRSMWNKAHGVMRALKFDSWADVGVMGHIHTHGMQVETGADQKIKTALVVRGFKEMDPYAEELNLTEDPYGHSCTTVLDPRAPDTERVRVIWDPEEASDFLGWLRKRRS